MSAYCLEEFDFLHILKKCQDRNRKIIYRVNIKIKIQVSSKFSKNYLPYFSIQVLNFKHQILLRLNP